MEIEDRQAGREHLDEAELFQQGDSHGAAFDPEAIRRNEDGPCSA